MSEGTFSNVGDQLYVHLSKRFNNKTANFACFNVGNYVKKVID